MNKGKILAVLSLLAASLLISGPAYAATVGAACTVQTHRVDFGQYNDASGNLTTGDIIVRCPAAFPYNIALDSVFVIF